ncbi:VWA domain-containing protein [Moritella marina]|uniref:VWA domain-containing protein n=1 Tax=Moritella marina TaxID=90736 RepID=UPI003704CB4C
MNITLDYPWLLLLLVLPYFIYRFLPAYMQPSVSLYIPFFQRVVAATGQTPNAGAVAHQRQLIQSIALILFWFGLIFSLARPVLLGEVQVTEKAGRDLMIAVDLSQSMEQKDYFMAGDKQQAISRIDALKAVLSAFSKDRAGDRLGLIVFGSGAYLQVPFTDDLQLWLNLLNDMDTQMAGPATAIGDAIGLSIRAFEQSNSTQRLLLLVTDGSDTHSRLDAVDAARVAATDGINIYTLGMGDPKTEGDDKVDFASLEKIAKVSNGLSYVAADSDSLQKVLVDINNIAPANYEQQRFQPKADLYPWLMGPLLLFYVLVWGFLTIQVYWKNRARGKYVE